MGKRKSKAEEESSLSEVSDADDMNEGDESGDSESVTDSYSDEDDSGDDAAVDLLFSRGLTLADDTDEDGAASGNKSNDNDAEDEYDAEDESNEEEAGVDQERAGTWEEAKLAQKAAGSDHANSLWPSFNSTTRASNATGGILFANNDDGEEEKVGRHKGRSSWPADVDFYSSSEDDELDGDTNTIGNVPLEWYKHYDHVGYNIFGKKLLKSEQADSLDRLLSRADDPAYWSTVRDEMNQRDVVLSAKELDLLRAGQQGQFPLGYDPFLVVPESDYAAGRVHGLSAAPEPKSRFLPSKWEQDKIRRIVRGLARGVIKVPGADETETAEEKRRRDAARFYALWQDADDDEAASNARFMHIPAPRPALPGHAESYRPPAEFLFSEEERKAWEEQDEAKRSISHVPVRLDALRQVPLYEQGLKERFERCLDLYLCPRTVKKRQNVNPKDLLPSLPKPHELRPFPLAEALRYRGHTDAVRSLSVDPTGQWLASGSDDGTVRVWEVSTGRCLRVWDFRREWKQNPKAKGDSDHPMDGDDGGDDDDDSDAGAETLFVRCVSWCPRAGIPIIVVACGSFLFFCNAGVGTAENREMANIMLKSTSAATSSKSSKSKKSGRPGLSWSSVPYRRLAEQGCSLLIDQGRTIRQVVWHRRGDYLASVAPRAGSRAILVHQLSSQSSQSPFSKLKGAISVVQFHPNKPLFFVCADQSVRVYDLMKQSLVKKLSPGCRNLSSISVHPGGDNVLVGSLDRRVCWFDLDYGAKPYRVLRTGASVHTVTFHSRLPLFASVGENAIDIFHGMVYNDLLNDPLIVPVKKLRHRNALDCAFVPKQPWLVSSAEDGSMILWTS